MRAFVCGELGYKPWEYSRLHWKDLWLIVKGHSNRQKREYEERAFYWREIYALIINVNRGENTPPITGAKIHPLSSDKHTKPIVPTTDILQSMKDLTERMNNGS